MQAAEADTESAWIGSSGAQNFRVMDDLEPTAPMDKVDPAGVVSILSPEPLPAEHHNSLYIPPYSNPDAFPVVNGPKCTCETPEQLPPTPQQLEWAKEVAKQLKLKVSELPKPLPDVGHTKCVCDEEAPGAPPHDWSKMVAIPGSRKFLLVPADSTYPNGDYWSPVPQGGLVAPADQMPMNQYPLQASSDMIQPVPTMANEDKIGLKFARYMDQVEARSVRCDGDGVSKSCVVPCRPGDKVTATLGQKVLDAAVVGTYMSGAFVVEFRPKFAQGFLGSVPCPLQASCSAFRACRRPGSFCRPRESLHSRDYLGNLQLTLRCPPGTQVCASVQQVVSGKYLRKDGKACVAEGPIAEPME